jgi:hypothetical protein
MERLSNRQQHIGRQERLFLPEKKIREQQRKLPVK